MRYLGIIVSVYFIIMHKMDSICNFGSDTSSCHGRCFPAEQEGKGKGKHADSELSR